MGTAERVDIFFLIELVDAIIKSAGEERMEGLVGIRVGSECGPAGGYTFDDTKCLVGQLK